MTRAQQRQSFERAHTCFLKLGRIIIVVLFSVVVTRTCVKTILAYVCCVGDVLSLSGWSFAKVVGGVQFMVLALLCLIMQSI